MTIANARSEQAIPAFPDNSAPMTESVTVEIIVFIILIF